MSFLDRRLPRPNTYLAKRKLENEVIVQIELAAARRRRDEVASLTHLPGPDLAVLREARVLGSHVLRVEHHGPEDLGAPSDCFLVKKGFKSALGKKARCGVVPGWENMHWLNIASWWNMICLVPPSLLGATVLRELGPAITLSGMLLRGASLVFPDQHGPVSFISSPLLRVWEREKREKGEEGLECYATPRQRTSNCTAARGQRI